MNECLVVYFITCEWHWNTIHFIDQTTALFLKEILKNMLMGPTVGSILLITSWSIWMSFSSKHFCISCNSEHTWWVGCFWEGKKDQCAKRFLRTYRWQRLVNLDRIQAPRAKALLSLLLLVLFHGLFNAYLGSAPYTLFKWLQLIIEGVLVLLICCLWEDTNFLN